MKDKKAAQIEAKQKNIAELAAAKARRRAEPILERTVPTKIEKPTILIVCEGKNTEPSYFRQFKLISATIKAIGNGYNTTSLVNHAITLNQQGAYDQVWCVFDKDQFPANDFNNAITIAAANNSELHIQTKHLNIGSFSILKTIKVVECIEMNMMIQLMTT